MFMKSTISLLAVFLAACSNPPMTLQAKSPGLGSLASYPVPSEEGGGPEMTYCFHYSKRIWELTHLVQEKQITAQKAQEITKTSLGSQAVQEDLADLDRLSRESLTPEQLAGERFMRCAQALRLPVEPRHLLISQSCFGLLKLPRHVYALKARGQTSTQVKSTLLAANPVSTSSLLNSTVDDVYAVSTDTQFNELNQTIFLSCIVAGGSPGVAQR